MLMFSVTLLGVMEASPSWLLLAMWLSSLDLLAGQGNQVL